MSSPIGTIYRECAHFYYMLEFQLSCFGILERYIRPRIFSIDKDNHLCYEKLCQIGQPDLWNFEKRALLWKLSDFEVPSFWQFVFAVGLCYQVHHKTYTSKLLHRSTLQDFHYLPFQSFCIQPVSRVHSILAVMLFALLVSGHSLFEKFEFYL